jgi:hypothetical protein
LPDLQPNSPAIRQKYGEKCAAAVDLQPTTSKPDRLLAAAMFNLGYLPGADKACITRPESTLAGLSACLERLKPGGLISLVAYLGHPGGLEEYEAVRRMLESLDGQRWQWQEIRAPSDRAPRLLCCWRL